MGTEPGEGHDTAVYDQHHNGMVDGLQRLGLDEQIVECLGRPTELGILKVFSYKGLHHSNGSDILLHGTVEVIIAEEHLGEEFHRTGDNHIECNAEDDQRDKENETHLEVDEHAHQHGENHVERCPDRYAHEHLESVLQVGHIGRHTRNQSGGGELVDVSERERLDVAVHGITKVVCKSRGSLCRAAP